MNADKYRFETQHETVLAFHLRVSVTCMDAQMPRAHDCMDAGGRATPGAVAEDAAEKLLLRLSPQGRLRAPHFRHPWRLQERLFICGQGVI
jgi:hypothetical protein